MADLDNFFAKKDKRKIKGKNYTSTNEMARRLEETEKKLEKEIQKEKEIPAPKPIEKVPEETTDGVPAVPVPVVEVKPLKKGSTNRKSFSDHAQTLVLQEEEEWNDFEDKPMKDLTDLKITRLHVEDDEMHGDGTNQAEDGGEDGEDGDRKDGVWKTEKQHATQAPVVAEEEETEETEEAKDGMSNVIAGSYVPPHMRNMAPSPLPRAGGGGGGGYRKGKLAPDITNEMAFPSLSDAQASNPAGAWGRRSKYDERQGFENVRHGSSRVAQDEFTPAKLSTANRFDALTDHS